MNRLFQRTPSFLLVETDFPANGNRFFCSEVFPPRKLSLKLVEANCKEHILTNATNFLASETRFSDNSQLLPVKTVHSSPGTYFSANTSSRGNEYFVYWK